MKQLECSYTNGRNVTWYSQPLRKQFVSFLYNEVPTYLSQQFYLFIPSLKINKDISLHKLFYVTILIKETKTCSNEVIHLDFRSFLYDLETLSCLKNNFLAGKCLDY